LSSSILLIGFQIKRISQVLTEVSYVSYIFNGFYHIRTSVEPSQYRIDFGQVFERVLDGGIALPDVYVVVIHVEKGTSSTYQTKTNHVYIRRDGSVFEMTPEMIKQRALQEYHQKRKKEGEEMKEHIRQVLKEIQVPGIELLRDEKKKPETAITFDSAAIKQLTSMGFKRSLILDVYYQLKEEGHDDPKLNVVLDRLSEARLQEEEKNKKMGSALTAAQTSTVPSVVNSPKACQYCSREFLLEKDLQVHELNCSSSPQKKKPKKGEPQVSPEPGLPCEFCSKLFPSSELYPHEVSCRQVQR